jgi:arginase
MSLSGTPIPFAGCLTTDPSTPTPWVLLGIPDDSQSSYLRGSDGAPERIRNVYDGQSFNSTSESGVDLNGSVIDHGDLKTHDSWASSADHYRTSLESLLEDGKTPFIAGGDHAITVPAVAAFGVLNGPLHVVQIDAHADLYPSYEGSLTSHACVAARLLEMDHVTSVTQLGIRTMNEEQCRQLALHEDRVHIFHARDLSGELPALEHIPADAPVYMTIDMDGFDPAFAPGVSHPVPGGLNSRQVLSFIQRGHWNLVGMDVVELNPSRDVANLTAILSARILHEAMGYAARRRAEKHSSP